MLNAFCFSPWNFCFSSQKDVQLLQSSNTESILLTSRCIYVSSHPTQRCPVGILIASMDRTLLTASQHSAVHKHSKPCLLHPWIILLVHCICVSSILQSLNTVIHTQCILHQSMEPHRKMSSNLQSSNTVKHAHCISLHICIQHSHTSDNIPAFCSP